MKKLNVVKNLILGVILGMGITSANAKVINLFFLDNHTEATVDFSEKLEEKSNLKIEVISSSLALFQRAMQINNDGDNLVIITEGTDGLLLDANDKTVKQCKLSSLDDTSKCVTKANIGFLEKIGLDGHVSGTLSLDSDLSRNREQVFAKTYDFEVTEDCRRVGISLDSTHNSFLFVMQNFALTDSNNDEDSPNAYLELDMLKGNYQLEATTFAKQETGTFDLTVKDKGACHVFTNLYIEKTGIDIASPRVGEMVNLSAVHRYQGRHPMYPVTVSVHISKDKIADINDYSLGNQTFYFSNQKETMQVLKEIPDFLTGDVYLTYITDIYDKVRENNEDDNVVVVPITIKPKYEETNLILENTVNNPWLFNTGNTLSMTTLVKNTGEEAVESVSVNYYATNSSVLDYSQAIHLGTQHFSVNGNAQESKKISITLPSGVEDGLYYLYSILDEEEALIESDRGNNVDIDYFYKIGWFFW